MLFITLEDMTDKIELVVFATTLEKNPGAFVENKVVFVYGRLDNRDGETKIVADRVEEITEASENSFNSPKEFSFGSTSQNTANHDKFLF